MKKILLICFTVFLAHNFIYSQNFKEVKTAQDVIDNYIEANGGKDNLRAVKSISMTGTINLMGKDVPLFVYLSKSILYFNLAGKEFAFTSALDIDNKIGWNKLGTQVKEMDENDIARNKENAETALWGYYTNKDDYGITYELMQNEQVNGKEAYVVDFNKKDTTVMTVYFDTKSFMRVKQHKIRQFSEYSDFKPVNGVYMAYHINSEQGELKITDFEFNGKFDKKLLVNPENEKK